MIVVILWAGGLLSPFDLPGRRTDERIAVIPRPISVECPPGPAPPTAASVRSENLEIAAWDGVDCDAILVEATNVSAKPLLLWDEPLRWGFADEQLFLEPVYQEFEGVPRRATGHPVGTLCGCFMDDEPYPVFTLPPGETHRWAVARTPVETSDTRTQCGEGFVGWRPEPLTFDRITVRVSSTQWPNRNGENGEFSPFQWNWRAVARVTLQLDEPLEAQVFEPVWNEMPFYDGLSFDVY